MKDIASIVKECTSLSTLALDGIQLNSQMIRILIQAARRHLTLKNISASGCSLSDDSMKSMAYLLRTNKKISKLNLSANEFTCEGLQFLQSTSPFSLEQLDISYNKIGNRGVSIISHLLRANLLPNLVRLELKQVGADLRTLTELFSSIPASSPLQYIDISGNHLFGKSAASSVAEDPTQSLYGSTYAARRRLKKLLPSALSDALDSAVSSVNSQWLYRSGSGTAAEEKKQKQKQKQKLGKTPRTQSNKIRAKGTSVRKRSRFPTPQRTGERKAAVSRNSSAKTASRAISVTKNNPCRDFVREMVKFAYSRPAVQQATELDTACIDDLNLHCDTETDATTSVESSSSTSQVSDNDILPPSPAAAAVYIGLAKTGLDDAFAHDLARTMTAQRKQATGLSGVTKKWVLRLGCELNDLSDRALEAIFKKTQTCKIIP